MKTTATTKAVSSPPGENEHWNTKWRQTTSCAGQKPVVDGKNDLQIQGAGRKSRKQPTLFVGIKPNGKSQMNGEVGQAFTFDGMGSYAKVPASPGLNVGLGGGFTIELWVNPANPNNVQPILEWNSNVGRLSGTGVQLWLSAGGPNELHVNILDTRGNNHHLGANNVMTPDKFQQVAVTYDKATGLAVLYRNGTGVATQTMGCFTPQTSFDLYFGLRPSGSFSGIYFQGMLDEVKLYNRSRSAAEIQADYEAEKAIN